MRSVELVVPAHFLFWKFDLLFVADKASYWKSFILFTPFSIPFELQPIKQADSDRNFDLVISRTYDPTRLVRWASEYLRTRATGAESTLRYKHQDLAHFIQWFADAFRRDDLRRLNTAVSNVYVQALDSETIPEGQRSACKESGSLRFAARSKNR
jgi:hypothetical protein